MHDAILGRLPLFQNLTGNTRREFYQQLRPLVLPRGQVLFHADDAADGLYVLLSGKVKMTRPSRQGQAVRRPAAGPAPRESILALMGPGEVFGELSLLDGGTRSTTATAMIDCQLLHIGREEMARLLAEHHDLAQAMLLQMAHRVRAQNETISQLVLSDVPGRLAHLLLGLAEHFGVATPRGVEVHHDLTQAELAQMVGASRETVNKVLTDFAARRWITMSGKCVVIREPERLRARID